MARCHFKSKNASVPRRVNGYRHHFRIFCVPRRFLVHLGITPDKESAEPRDGTGWRGARNMQPEQVFEILARENSDMLLAFLRSAVRDSSAVDDLFQETMLVAWRKLAEYDRARPFGAWLRGIAGNLALAHSRQTAGEVRLLDPESLEWLESRFAQLQRLRGDTLSEKLSALRECVAGLPDEYRQPLEMRYGHAQSLAEIGAALELAIETLKKRLTRAKLRLADCLERKLNELEWA